MFIEVDFNDLLAELENDPKWRTVKGGDAPEPRFKEREMILRFLALANRVDFYTGGLKRFLNDYMAYWAPHDPSQSTNRNKCSGKRCRMCLPCSAQFWTLYNVPPEGPAGKWDTKFSIAALEIQGSALLRQEPAIVQQVADQIREHFLFLLLTDNAIQDAISKHTSGRAATTLRWTKLKSVIQPLLDNVVKEPRFFSFQFRKGLYDKNPICAICANQIHSLEDSTVDHIDPYSKGGKTVPENGQLTHSYCNAIKNATVSPSS